MKSAGFLIGVLAGFVSLIAASLALTHAPSAPDSFRAQAQDLHAVGSKDGEVLAVPMRQYGWHVVPSPNVGTGVNILMSVSAISQNDAWAVGTYDTVAQGGRTLIQRWNGQEWATVPSPNVSSGPHGLFAVAAVSSDDVWGVGAYYQGATQYTLIEHWDGTAWQQVPSPNPYPSVGSALNAVSAISANNVWAVGGYFPGGGAWIDRTLIEHWNGQTWEIVPSPNGPGFNYLSGVSGLSGNDVWAVGFFAPDGNIHHGRTLTMHWNGTQWTIVPSPTPAGATGARLQSVHFVKPNYGWAVGHYSLNNVYHTLVLRWDGSLWSIVPSYDAPGAAWNELFAVAATRTDVWAVGAYSMDPNPNAGEFAPPVAFPGARTMILRWNGSSQSWERVQSPNLGDGSELIGLGTGRNTAWAVGSHVVGAGPAQTLIEHLRPRNSDED